MGKTIIQTIGPLYGEVVNGTVFGRPNGSIYVPSVNTISANSKTPVEYVRIMTYGGNSVLQACSSSGTTSANYTLKVVAEAQDVQSYIGICIEDSDGVQVGNAVNYSAGLFNLNVSVLGYPAEDTITNGADYTVVMTLYSASGVPVATAKIPVVGWAE